MKIYTKTGDTGETGILGGYRVAKDHALICAIGDVDETNSHLGLACSYELAEQIAGTLSRVQRELFVAGSQLASYRSVKAVPTKIDEQSICWIESQIDHFNDGLPDLDAFILPGGVPAAAQLHVARCVCRRAERSVVALLQKEPNESDLSFVVVYLNRLSDLLFVLARRTNFENSCSEAKWLP